MDLLLRIINQNLSQCEESVTHPLGGQGYRTLIQVDNTCIQSGDTEFQKLLYKYKEEQQLPVLHESVIEPIIGFVTSNETGKYYPIKHFQVAYIVNDKGQTLERVYGQYQKH